MQYSIEGEEASQSPRTQEKPATQQFDFYQMEGETAQEKRSQQPEESSIQPPITQQPEGEQKGCTRFCTVAFYQQFFNVSQDQVIERIKLNFMPFKPDFLQKIRDNPDFYGPFWILSTIIFLLSSTGNLSRYFYNWEKSEYIFKLEMVRYGVILVYSIGFGVPLVLFLVLRFMKCDTLKLPDLICLYGYSFGCFILVFLLCIIPFSWLHWLLMIYGMVNSIAFLILNTRQYLQTLEKKSLVIFGIIGAAQIFLFLMFKLVFFDLIYEGQQ